LDDDRADQDHQEKLIVEEALKDIVFIRFKLSGIDFIEDLQKDENVKEDGVMLSSFIVPFAHTN